MVNKILEKLIGNNGKITSSKQNVNSYLIYINFVDFTKRNKRINKKNNEDYWRPKLNKILEPRMLIVHFIDDNHVGLWIEKIIKEERKEKLNKIQNVNKK